MTRCTSHLGDDDGTAALQRYNFSVQHSLSSGAFWSATGATEAHFEDSHGILQLCNTSCLKTCITGRFHRLAARALGVVQVEIAPKQLCKTAPCIHQLFYTQVVPHELALNVCTL